MQTIATTSRTGRLARWVAVARHRVIPTINANHMLSVNAFTFPAICSFWTHVERNPAMQWPARIW